MKLDVALFTDQNFLVNFIFGLVIIVMYAKDKFNMPTYDKEAMGPFSQLPPRLLTVDSRYRQGLRTYVLSLAIVYTAICIIGPNTFGDQKISLGFTSNSNQLWPVAAATFLVSTGVARDSSMLGRIELFFRQYAHKTAYIPNTVRDLAHGLRMVELRPWLFSNDHKLRPQDFEARRDALVRLIREENLPAEADQAGFGHRAAWARANIAYSSLLQIRGGALGREKLAELADTQENRDIFDRLAKMHEQIRNDFKALQGASQEGASQAQAGSEEVSDKLLASIQRFSKEVSLMIVVLLSQGARSPIALQEQLEQLGFRSIDLGDHSDHLVYIILVATSVVVAGVIAFGLHFLMSHFFDVLQITQVEPADLFSKANFTKEFVIIGTAMLIYIVTFRIVDYLRERSLDMAEWQEGLRGYVMTVLPAAFISTIFSLLLLVLVLAPFGLSLWRDFTGLLLFFFFQLCVSILTAAFSLAYIGRAVGMKWPGSERPDQDDARTRWAWMRAVAQSVFRFKGPEDFLKVVHAVFAVLLVGSMTFFIAMNSRNNVLDDLKADLDGARRHLKTHQEALQSKLNATLPPRSATTTQASIQQVVTLPKLQGAVFIGDMDNYFRSLYARIGAPIGDRGTESFNDHLKKLTEMCETLNTLALNAPGQEPVEVPAVTRPTLQSVPSTAVPTVARPTLQSVPSAAPESQTQTVVAVSAGPPPPAIVERLFKVPNRCEPDDSVREDKPVVDFGRVLAGLHGSLNYLRATSGPQSKIGEFLVPMLTAFVMAYLFGAGSRLFRAWWLQNESGREEVLRLKEQLTKHIGPIAPDAFDRWLRQPLAFLNRVTPLEAVRYEGLKARLFARIENQRHDQLNLDGILESKGATTT